MKFKDYLLYFVVIISILSLVLVLNFHGNSKVPFSENQVNLLLNQPNPIGTTSSSFYPTITIINQADYGINLKNINCKICQNQSYSPIAEGVFIPPHSSWKTTLNGELSSDLFKNGSLEGVSSQTHIFNAKYTVSNEPPSMFHILS